MGEEQEPSGQLSDRFYMPGSSSQGYMLSTVSKDRAQALFLFPKNRKKVLDSRCGVCYNGAPQTSPCGRIFIIPYLSAFVNRQNAQSLKQELSRNLCNLPIDRPRESHFVNLKSRFFL